MDAHHEGRRDGGQLCVVPTSCRGRVAAGRAGKSAEVGALAVMENFL